VAGDRGGEVTGEDEVTHGVDVRRRRSVLLERRNARAD
jgi:hypothetical protein